MAVAAVLLAGCASGGSPAARAGNSVVVLGDSLTAPIGRPDRDDDWWRWADPDRRFEVIANAGVPGERTDQILARVERDVIVRGPRWCTVLAGTNDVALNVDAATIIANLTSIYDALTSAGIGVIAFTLPPLVMMDPSKVAAHQEVNAWLREHVTTDWPGSVLVDWAAELSTTGDGTGPRPEYFRDGVHFSPAGAEAAGRLAKAVLDDVAVGGSGGAGGVSSGR